MSGIEMMPDIPRSSGNTFIIYSTGTKPEVRQAPTLSAVTELDSVSGGLDNEFLSITWQDGWQVACKKTSAWGQFSFDVTVKSKGSDTRKADSQKFTFEVLLLGVDQSFDYFFYQFRVGEKVNYKLEQMPAGAVRSYGKHGQLYSADEEQYASGLFLSLRKEGDMEFPYISGTALRPGIYVAAVHCASDDVGTFSGGNDMLAPVVVAVRDKTYEDGQLMVIADNGVQFNENALRLIYVDDNLFNNRGGNFCIRMSGGDGVWTGKNEEQAQTTVFVTEYQITLTGSRWQLSRREYTQGDQPPEWKQVSSVGKIDGSSLPPSAGWNNGVVVSGDTRYFVPGYGLFDYKGVDALGEFFQQQTTHTRQYDGWNTAAEYTNDSGYMLRRKEVDDNLEWTLPGLGDLGNVVDKVVHPQPVDGVVFPYSPAVTEKYGSRAVRDLTFSGLSAHVAPGTPAIASGGFASGFFATPDVRRQLVPYNGTSGDVKRKFSGVTVSVEKSSFTETGESHENTFIEGEGEHNKVNSSFRLEQGVKLAWGLDGKELPYARRSGDVFEWLMCAGNAEIEAEHTYSAEVSNTVVRDTYPVGGGTAPEKGLVSTTTAELVNESEIVTKSDAPSLLNYYIAGAPDAEENKQHQLWSVMRWTGGGASSTYRDVLRYTSTDKYADGSEETGSWERLYSGDISFYPNEFTFTPSRVKLGDDFAIEELIETEDVSTFTAAVKKVKYSWSYPPDGGEPVLDNTAVDTDYTLTIRLVKHYTKKNGKEVLNFASATYERREYSGGGYVTTSGTLEDEEVEDMITAAKEDVASCKLEDLDTIGDYVSGNWSNVGTRRKIAIESK